MYRRAWMVLLLAVGACEPAGEPVAPARAELRTGTERKLTAPSPSDGDWLGFSVDIDGDTAVAGAHGDDTRASDAGAVYVFVRSSGSWSMQQKLTASDGTSFDYFGWDVAVSGDTLVVGARRDDDRGTDYGSAYVFTRSGSTWTERAKLFPSDGVATDRFGWSVDIDGGTILIGAVTHDGPAMDSGAAYVFVGSGGSWGEQTKLVASDGTGGDFLGQALALDGDTALVGADEDNVGGEDSGSAYVFVRSGTSWSEQSKLTASDGAASDYFANAVAIDGDTALVGAWGQDASGADSGAAYVYVRSGTAWSEEQKIVPADGTAGDYFGRALALTGDVAIIGAYLDDDVGTDAGSVYVYERSGTSWSLRSETNASDTAAGDWLGCAVATDGTRVIVGARYDDHGGASEAGAAYVFQLRASTPADAGFDAGFDAGWDAGFDAGWDAGFDAGSDAGPADAGASDGGTADAGSSGDAGVPTDDGGASTADGGSGTDGSAPDFDAGPPSDAGSIVDDAATLVPDADPPDAPGGTRPEGGCSACSTSAGANRTTPPVWLCALILLLLRRRRGS